MKNETKNKIINFIEKLLKYEKEYTVPHLCNHKDYKVVQVNSRINLKAKIENMDIVKSIELEATHKLLDSLHNNGSIVHKWDGKHDYSKRKKYNIDSKLFVLVKKSK